MKHVLFKILTVAFLFAAIAVNGQGRILGSSSGTALTGSDTTLATLTPAYFGDATIAVIGTLWEKGAAQDSLAKIIVYHAISQDGIDANGIKVSTDTLRFNNGAATEYDEETITIAGGITYLKVVLDRVATSTDTSTVKPYIKVFR